MQIRGTYYCCGINEFGGFGGSLRWERDEVTVIACQYLTTTPRSGLIFFSDNLTSGRGKAFAEQIRKHKLGDLIESMAATNPYHSHLTSVQMWVWRPNYKAITALADSKPMSEYYKDGKWMFEVSNPIIYTSEIEQAELGDKSTTASRHILGRAPGAGGQDRHVVDLENVPEAAQPVRRPKLKRDNIRL